MKLLQAILFLFIIINVPTARAAFGCLDNSNHSETKEIYYQRFDSSLKPATYQDPTVHQNDYKVWSPVQCDCPCERQQKDHVGTCPVCKHRGKIDRISGEKAEFDVTKLTLFTAHAKQRTQKNRIAK